MNNQDPTPGPGTSEAAAAGGRSRTVPTAIALALVVLAGGGFALYGIAHSGGKRVAHTGACAQSLDLAQAAIPLVHGDVAALTLASRPQKLDRISFDDGDGRKTSVAAFGGRTILLNLWATWCVPCRAEMPALNKLQGELGSDRFTVVPVDIDTVRLDRPRAFLKEIGATSLPFYADPTADILQSLKGVINIVGLPTTVLIGRDGCEIASMAGPAEWDSPDATALIRRLTQPVSSARAEL